MSKLQIYVYAYNIKYLFSTYLKTLCKEGINLYKEKITNYIDCEKLWKLECWFNSIFSSIFILDQN